jgi:uncharacterized protein
MPAINIIVLIIVFFLTTVVGVVTGSNSLITVPVMFQFGIDEKVAVATNMLGLTFMSVGASIPFLRQDRINIRRVSPMIGLTIVGSAIGAAMVGLITNQAIKVIVTVAMITMTVFTVLRRNPKYRERHHVSTASLVSAYVLTFLLAIYGGLYSGGYVTILTAMVIALLGMTFTEAVASTKLINVFSSGIATLVFAWQGLIDYKLGLILGITMFAGAMFGAHYATKLNETWLRRIFMTTVFVLALKLIYDLAAS